MPATGFSRSELSTKMKHKKTLLILAAALLTAALALAVTALVIRQKENAHPAEISVSEESGIACTDVPIRIKKAYRKQYAAVSSYNIGGVPDENIKKAVFNRLMEENRSLLRFDLLKTYGAFRLYDVEVQSGETRETCLMTVFAQGDVAVLFQTKPYTSSAQRADALTKQIEAFDNDYMKLVKTATGLDKTDRLY